MKSDAGSVNEEGWEYGDVWKKGAPDETVVNDETEYVDILRGDSGKGYDDSLMLDMVTYLGSRGIQATYDSFSIGLEPAAIKTYVLKVQSGREREALEFLNEEFLSQGPANAG